MSVTRWQVVSRGAAGCCPNCGGKTLFVPGTLFKVNPVCPACGLKIEKGEGAFLGPLVVNYGVTVFGFVLPLIVLFIRGNLSGGVTLAGAAAAAFILPLLLYRLSWGWWLMIYYFFLPENLPANLQGEPESDE